MVWSFHTVRSQDGKEYIKCQAPLKALKTQDIEKKITEKKITEIIKGLTEMFSPLNDCTTYMGNMYTYFLLSLG